MLDTVLAVLCCEHCVGGVLGEHGWDTEKQFIGNDWAGSVTTVLLRFDATITSQYDMCVLIIGNGFGVFLNSFLMCQLNLEL